MHNRGATGDATLQVAYWEPTTSRHRRALGTVRQPGAGAFQMPDPQRYSSSARSSDRTTVVERQPWLASRLLHAVLLAGAVVAAVLTLWTYTSSEAVPDGYIETTGYFAGELGGSAENADDSIIVFRDGDGVEFRFASDSSGSEGQQIKVAFDPVDPEATAGTADDRRGQLWYVPAAVAAVLAFAAFVLYGVTRD